MFKITHPAVVSLHAAGLPDGVGDFYATSAGK